MTGFFIQDLLHVTHEHAQNLYDIRRKAIRSASIDSRTLKHGELFIALRGEKFDGHDFIAEAMKRGARACMVDEKWYAKHGKKFGRAHLLIVNDTLTSLGDLAREYRKRFDIPIIAITGSNGKTTTKEMIAAALKTRYNVLYTTGNYNNQIGLPLTLLRLAPQHRVAVVEMGTNSPGEIEALCSIARHSHAVITNIGRAHVELLKDRRGIAKEKGAIFRTLPQYGIAFINADESLIKQAAPELTKKIYYGRQEYCTVRLEAVELDARGYPTMLITAPKYTKKVISLKLKMIGAHSAQNALASFAVGFVFQCPTSKMIDALESLQSYEKRLRVHQVGDVTILDDSYNANPDSTIAAIDSLTAVQVKGKKILVLGDMLELGKESKKEHQRIGAYITRRKADAVFTFGTDARFIAQAAAKQKIPTQHHANKTKLLSALHEIIQSGDAILVKGSRGMQMEEVTEVLRKKYQKGS